MMSRETAKDRAARIPYDYQKDPDRFIRRRLLLTGLALVAAAGWVAWGLYEEDRVRLSASHGPLARSHAMWESQCDACHVPPPDVRKVSLDRPWPPGVASEQGDAKCKVCHMGHPDQAHHREQESRATQHCASCHRDHRGREASLIRTDEAQCTSCHGDLDRWLAVPPAAADLDRAVAHFYDGSHPGFRGPDDRVRPGAGTSRHMSDPGRLKFNHALHMTEGLKAGPDDVDLFTFAQLDPEGRARYGWSEGRKLTDPVRLECASCHQPYARDRTSRAGGVTRSEAITVAASRDAGAYMAPASYQRHCAACHTLEVPGRVAETSAGGEGAGGGWREGEAGGTARKGLVAVRHGLQPAELRDELTASYVGLALGEDPELLDGLGARRLPGTPSRSESARRDVDRRVASAERILFGKGKGTCTECHDYDTADGQPVEGAGGRIDPTRFRVVAPDVPGVWLRHAFFDHSAHRAMECRACHFGADPEDSRSLARAARELAGIAPPKFKDGKEASTSREDVLVPDIQVCRDCHAPVHRSGDRRLGGAGFECTECHTYHNGDHPGEGRGASARGAREKVDLLKFLHGPE